MNEDKEAILKHSELPKLESTGQRAEETANADLTAKVGVVPHQPPADIKHTVTGRRGKKGM